MKEVIAAGVMSGSSLDGLDISVCRYYKRAGYWDFEYIEGQSVPFPEDLYQGLKVCRTLPAAELAHLDMKLGRWIGQQIKQLSSVRSIEIIGSHGHTVFHDPTRGYTLQIGSGEAIAHISGKPTYHDFRVKDVLNGGEGAPLAPIGDHHLFRDHEVCVNLGGIANASVKKQEGIVAWDICPCNQVLNKLSERLDQPFDRGGQIGKTGKMLSDWYRQLGTEPFYQKQPPKSISNEWVQSAYLDHLPDLPPADMLHTFTKFMADRICTDIRGIVKEGKVLLTGGGAFNDFLIECLSETGKGLTFEMPSGEIIEFKEAIFMGLMAVLRQNDEVNVLASATGARTDSRAGVLVLP